ncbi:MAG: preprotein translocase subunit SecG [Candidatus Shapirobacteria bacterium]|nr:preprotein translocase subunit SecG [Candidatus Shapirobacteria bacterium]MDD3002896.1 preprotein translocase subunit SecG [Candidatus Shapirobacteria bacterium]MDD4382582.1 preprotein translocase subunit SecG [Candidatus Shapirobacteria bacterium]
MKTTLVIIQIILSILLSALIFLQSNGDTESRSNILSATTVEKRGWEKIMFNFTIFIIVLFLISSVIQTLL